MIDLFRHLSVDEINYRLDELKLKRKVLVDKINQIDSDIIGYREELRNRKLSEEKNNLNDGEEI